MAVLILQIVEVSAAMSLPTLNASIIDKGVLTGNTFYILRMGAKGAYFNLYNAQLAAAAIEDL